MNRQNHLFQFSGIVIADAARKSAEYHADRQKVAALVVAYEQYVGQAPTSLRKLSTVASYEAEMTRESTSIAHWQLGK